MIDALLQGLTGAFADHVTGERDRARQQEDNQLDEQMKLIQALISRPDMNPNLIGRALTDLTALQRAKGSQRKMKGGKEGFLGASELPISQFLQGLGDGSMPTMGSTYEQMQKPPVPTEVAGVQSPQMIMPPIHDMGIEAQRDGFTGLSVLSDPINVPPPAIPTPPEATKLIGAARDVQTYNAMSPQQRRVPVKNQPLLRSPQEMMQEEADRAGMVTRSKTTAEIGGKLDALSQFGGQQGTGDQGGAFGITPEEVARDAFGLPTFRPNGTLVMATNPRTGEKHLQQAVFDPQRKMYFTTDGTNTPLMDAVQQPITPYRPPALVGMLAAKLGIDISGGFNNLQPGDAMKLQTAMQSSEFDQFAKRANLTQELQIARAWAQPLSAFESYTTGVPYGFSRAEAGGRTALPSDVRQRIQGTDGLMQFLDRVDGLTKQLLTGDASIWDRVGNTVYMNKERMMASPTYRALETEIKTNLANIARVSGDVGNIAVQEGERYLAGLPQMGGWTSLSDSLPGALAATHSMRQNAAARAGAMAGEKYDPNMDPKQFIDQLFNKISPSSAIPNVPAGGTGRQIVNPPQAAPTLGQVVNVDGRPAVVMGFNPQTGKPIVKFQ